MTLRGSFRRSRPDLDRFLFATSGDENREAIEQLALLIAELPGLFRPLGEVREIADRLIQLLPRHDTDRKSPPQVQIRLCYLRPAPLRTSQLWLARLVLAAAVLVSAFLHGGLPFGIGSP